MAQIQVTTITSTGFWWSITGLSSGFNTTHYQYARITSTNAYNGTILDSEAPASSTATDTFTPWYTGGTVSYFTPSLNPVGQTFYGWVEDVANGIWYACGSVTVTPLAMFQIPSMSAYSSTYNSLTYYVSGINTNATYIDINLYNALGSLVAARSLPTNGYTSMYVAFDSSTCTLSASTTYYAEVRDFNTITYQSSSFSASRVSNTTAALTPCPAPSISVFVSGSTATITFTNTSSYVPVYVYGTYYPASGSLSGILSNISCSSYGQQVSWTVTGLSNGSYTVYGGAQPTTSNTGYTSSSTNSTGSFSISVLVAPTVAPSIIGRAQTSVTLGITAVTGATSYTIRCNYAGTYSTTSLSTIINSLSIGTSYTWDYCASDGSTTTAYSPAAIVSTLPAVPVITASYNSGTTIVTINTISGGFTNVAVRKNGSTTQYISVNGGNTTFTSTVKTDTYDAQTSWAADGTTLYSGYCSAISAGRPPTITWTLTTGAACTTLTATMWNNLQTNINNMLLYEGLTVSSFPTVVSGNSFTHGIFNDVVTAVNRMKSTGVSSKNTGDVVKASEINMIVSTLNSVT